MLPWNLLDWCTQLLTEIACKTVYLYEFESGTERIKIQKDPKSAGQNILLFDDLISTDGTAEAAITQIKKCGGNELSVC